MKNINNVINEYEELLYVNNTKIEELQNENSLIKCIIRDLNYIKNDKELLLDIYSMGVSDERI